MRCIRHLYRGVSKELANPPVQSLSTFNSKLKTLQRSRAARLPDHEQYDYVRNDIAEYLTDRISDIKRDFPKVVELGCGKSHVYQHLNPYITKELLECDWSEECLQVPRDQTEIKLTQLLLEDETLPLEPGSADLVISNLAFHWVNDIPLMFKQVEHLLVPDGVFLGSMFAGDCIHELRVSLQQDEQERTGGISTHISPFATPQDIGSLLQSAGFVMITLDTEDVTVRYPDIHVIMRDLQGMGESNALLHMPRVLRRDVLQAASAIYQTLYGEEDGSLPLTFRVLYFIAWKNSEVAGKIKKRGSQSASLQDLDGIVSDKSGDL